MYLKNASKPLIPAHVLGDGRWLVSTRDAVLDSNNTMALTSGNG